MKKTFWLVINNHNMSLNLTQLKFKNHALYSHTLNCLNKNKNKKVQIVLIAQYF